MSGYNFLTLENDDGSKVPSDTMNLVSAELCAKMLINNVPVRNPEPETELYTSAPLTDDPESVADPGRFIWMGHWEKDAIKSSLRVKTDYPASTKDKCLRCVEPILGVPVYPPVAYISDRKIFILSVFAHCSPGCAKGTILMEKSTLMNHRLGLLAMFCKQHLGYPREKPIGYIPPSALACHCSTGWLTVAERLEQMGGGVDASLRSIPHEFQSTWFEVKDVEKIIYRNRQEFFKSVIRQRSTPEEQSSYAASLERAHEERQQEESRRKTAELLGAPSSSTSTRLTKSLSYASKKSVQTASTASSTSLSASVSEPPISTTPTPTTTLTTLHSASNTPQPTPTVAHSANPLAVPSLSSAEKTTKKRRGDKGEGRSASDSLPSPDVGDTEVKAAAKKAKTTRSKSDPSGKSRKAKDQSEGSARKQSKK